MTTESTSTAATLMGRVFDAIAAHDLDRLAEVWDERTTDVFIALDLTVTGEPANAICGCSSGSCLPHSRTWSW